MCKIGHSFQANNKKPREMNHRTFARCVTSFEYDSVSKEAIALGFDGFFQSKASATAKYTPDFD